MASLGNNFGLSAACKVFVENLALKKDAHIELRDYQVQAAANVLEKGNSLVVMPTALGKTFVAVLVIAKMLAIKPSSRFLFLAPTKPLVEQQAKRLREFLDLPLLPLEEVVVLSGEVAPSSRQAVWEAAKIVAATPQTVENDVLTRKTDLSQFDLVVFDEAHRTVKDYAYSFLAKQASKNPGTLLLGLTASPSADRDKVSQVCSNLQVKHIEIKSEKDLDVADFVNEVKVDWLFIDLPQEFLELSKILDALLKEALLGLRENGFLESADAAKISKREILAARFRILQAISQGERTAYSAMSLQAKCLNLMHAAEMLETQGIRSLKRFFMQSIEKREKSKAMKEILSDFRTTKLLHLCDKLLEKGVDHPKKEKLFEIIGKETLQGKSIIVFAHFRATVSEIEKEIKKIASAKPVQFVGRAGEGGMTQKKQAQILQEFREGKYNVLLSTSVGEEGIDVPRVDLVLFYEAVPSEIRFIQRRGRAGRTKAGNVMVLVSKGTRDEAYFWIAKAKEKKMKAHLQELKKNMETPPSRQFAQQGKNARLNDGQKSLGEF